MRVGIDISAAVARRPTGVSRAITGLLDGLSETALDDDRFVLFTRLSRWRPWRRAVRSGDSRFPTRLFRRRLSADLSASLDLFHGPDVRLPEGRSVPLVSTFHDLSALQEEGFTPEGFRDRRVRQWKDAVERAARIVTYSEFVRNEVIRRFAVPEDRVVSIPLGVSRVFRQASSERVEQVRRRHRLPRRFLLNVGGLSRRKGTSDLFEAFSHLRDREIGLVICGRDGHGGEEARAAIPSFGLDRRVHLLGHVPRDDDLAALYSGAEAFVLPSLYEGFGLAALEAMACGSPVIASRAGAIPEVVGHAGRLVPPGDSAALATAIEEVIGDPDLRSSLVGLGVQRANEFSWASTGRAVHRLYRSLLPDGPARP